MEWQIIVVLAVVVPLILFPVVFIWYVNIGGLYTMLRERQNKKAVAKERSREIAEEQAVVKVATAQERGERRPRVLTPTGKRARWAIGLTLGLPVIIALLPLFPVVFIWYINASGLYQVLRATRQRQRRREVEVRAASKAIPVRVKAGAEGK
jgi:hypothetical protein